MLLQKNIPRHIVDAIASDMRHNVERLPDGKTFRFEGNELRNNRELT